MDPADPDSRRQFLGRLGATAASVSLVSGTAEANPSLSGDGWMAGLKGTQTALFDFPSHRNGMPLLHILNYFNSYSVAYGLAPGQISAIGTFYGIGGQSSIALAFNDHIWQRYALGEYTGLSDRVGRPYTRNVFYRPTRDDLHLLMEAMQVPTIPMFIDVMPSIGIEELQRMGTTFLLCANALSGWCAELEARGKGTFAAIEADLRANLLPGVVIVPAMVIAIEQAQRAGIAYNRQ